VCHPYANDPEGNKAKVREICRGIKEEGHLPVAPQIYLDQFVSEEREREYALEACLDLLVICGEMRVYGSYISKGMAEEINFAQWARIKIERINTWL
jgi:dienelactone hydrolase